MGLRAVTKFILNQGISMNLWMSSYAYQNLFMKSCERIGSLHYMLNITDVEKNN